LCREKACATLWTHFVRKGVRDWVNTVEVTSYGRPGSTATLFIAN
jgi:hypothetical protein